MFRQVPVTTVGREHTKTDINSNTCKLSCCFSCSFCNRAATKERLKSRIDRCKFKRVSIKICQKCFFCHSIVLCESCNKCPSCCTKSTGRVQTSNFLANLGGSECRSKSSANVETGLHPPLLDQAKSVQISHCRKPVCQSPQEQLPVGGIATAYRQKCYRISSKSVFSRVFQPTFLSSETQQKMEANTRPEQTKYLSQSRKIQNGDTGNHQNIPPARGVGNLSRFQRRLLPYTNTGTVQEISKISCPGSDISIQGSAPMEFTVVAKEVKLIAMHRGIRIHQYLDDWLVRDTSYHTCLQHTETLVKICQDLGWLVNIEKSELEPKQVFDFVGYQFDLRSGRVRPTPDRWQNLQDKVKTLLARPTCSVRQFMSLIGLLTATEKHSLCHGRI